MIEGFPEDGVVTGLSVPEPGRVRIAYRRADGSAGTAAAEYEPFAWVAPDLAAGLPAGEVRIEELAGAGRLCRLVRFAPGSDAGGILRQAGGGPAVEFVRPDETQYLISTGGRFLRSGSMNDLVRLQLDIETATGGGRGFSDPGEKEDRVLAIGLRHPGGTELLELEEESDAAERALLKRFAERLLAIDPDTVEGHNCFRFDLEYLRQRCRRFRLAHGWGRFGEVARFRRSRIRIAERTLDFPRCDIPGRTVVDTFLLAQLYDVTKRELEGYGLKDVAVAFGVTDPERGDREYIPGALIAQAFRHDRDRFRRYLEGDLRETAGVAGILLPTFVAQCPNFPMSLQEVLLRGTAAKVDAVFLEEYYRARQALPLPPEVDSFEGGFTDSFATGVFRPVVHFDVASLYPSLLLQIGRNPGGDDLGIFAGKLRELRSERLAYKQSAREEADPARRRDLEARQASFKILINSFYGYLGFPGARFADGALAAEVTRRGRELIQGLIARIGELGARVLEADTDGLYVCPGDFSGESEDLLAALSAGLPEGIDLELGGEYDAMYCYKAKNYALLQNGAVIVRGSALRSRGTEPFLRELTAHHIAEKLGLVTRSTGDLLESLAEEIVEGNFPVERLAKPEFLGQSPEAYRVAVEEGGKPRRAALEAALKIEPRPRQGDRVVYYLRQGTKEEKADWQRAEPLDLFDPGERPYDPKAYLKKLRQWGNRFLTG